MAITMKSYYTPETQASLTALMLNIVTHAKKHRKEALNALVEQGVCLSFFQGSHNAIILLARQGQYNAVNFLLTHYGQNPDHAVIGYALGGHSLYVNELLADGANIDFATQAYAQGGHQTEVNALLKQGAKSNAAVKGYAINGNTTQVNNLMTTQGLYLYEFALQGYAMGGHTKQITDLLKVVHDKLPNEVFFTAHVLSGYALSNRLEEINEFIKNMAPTVINEARRYTEPYLIQGVGIDLQRCHEMTLTDKMNLIKPLAIGGHAIAVNQFLDEYQLTHPSKQELDETYSMLFSAYLQGGHLVEAAAIKKHLVSLDMLLISSHWPLHLINATIDETSKLDTSVESIRIASESLFDGYDEYRPMPQPRLLRLMTFINDNELRKEVAYTALMHNSEDSMSSEEEHNDASSTESPLYNPILLKAERQHYFMQNYQLNYRQVTSLSIPGALIWLLQGQLTLLQSSTTTSLIPKEIFLEITSYVLGIPYHEAKALTIVMQSRIYHKARFFESPPHTNNNNNTQPSHTIASPSPTSRDLDEAETGMDQENAVTLGKRKHP